MNRPGDEPVKREIFSFGVEQRYAFTNRRIHNKYSQVRTLDYFHIAFVKYATVEITNPCRSANNKRNTSTSLK